MAERAILGIDPGTAKCGLALVQEDGAVLFRAVVAPADLPVTLAQLVRERPITAVALGNRTGAATVRGLVEQSLPGVPVAPVTEHESTRQARRLYWQYHPPRGWRRLVPLGLLVPRLPLDGYAAEILARRLLARPAAAERS